MSVNTLTRAYALTVLAALLVLTGAPAHAAGVLKVLAVTPAGTDVPLGQEIVLQFNRSMVPLGRMGRAAVPVRIRPALHCQWRWLDSQRLSCRLPGRQRFRPATRYRIRIGTGWRALDGSRLAHPLSATFVTQTPRVRWAYFERWRRRTEPQYQVRFTLPVTAAVIERALRFSPLGAGPSVAAHARPFTRRRTGPLLLPVPGIPGAMVWIAHPQTPHSRSVRSSARSVWILTPAHALVAQRPYQITIGAGLVTPLGRLPGPQGDVPNTTFTPFGRFAFLGIHCLTAAGTWRTIAPPGVPADAAARCRPGTVQWAFTAPVPKKTLMAIQLHPAPAGAAQRRRLWSGYPPWMLAPAGPAGGSMQYRYRLPYRLGAMHPYRADLPAGVPDVFGSRLRHPVAVRFATGHLPPALSLGAPQGGVLEAREPTVLPVYFDNLTRLDFAYHALSAADLASATAVAAAPPVLTSLLAPFQDRPPRDQWLTRSLGVRADLGGRPGALLGQLTWAPSLGNQWFHWDSQQLFAEVTPWQVLAKVGHYDSLIWVSSLATGRPVPGVTVRFSAAPQNSLTGLHAVTAAAVTDAAGLAVLPGTVHLAGWDERFGPKALQWYVAATRGNDMALLPLTWNYERWISSASGGAVMQEQQPRYGHLRLWGLTAQGVYRPGATVHYAAFVRGMSATKLIAPPPLRYRFTITSATGKTVLARKDVALSTFGAVQGRWYIPTNAATGWYNMTVSWRVGMLRQSRPAGRFLVTEFVPDPFKVRLLLQGRRFGPSTTYRAQIMARLHSGGPYTDAPVRTVARLTAEPFVPRDPRAAGFLFQVNPPNAPSTVTLAERPGKLDARGDAQTSGLLPAAEPILYGRFTLQAAVKSARGTWVAHRARAIWAARSRFVGLRLDQWLLRAAQPFSVRYLVVDPYGRPASGAPVHVILQRRRLNVVETANGTGRFTARQTTQWVTEGGCRATSAAVPGACRLIAKQAGTYRIVATVRDTHGRRERTVLRTWAVGAGMVVWKTGTHVQLVPDRRDYHVGQVAQVLVQNPYPGARALVTVERYGVLWRKVVTLAGSTPVLHIPIERSFFPGAYLSVAIFSPRVAPPDKADLGRPTLALGYVSLPVVGRGSALTVTVVPAHSKYRPRQRVRVRVQVRTREGRVSRHTQLVVAVVDTSVLDLLAGRSRYYDPRRAFYAPPAGADLSNFSLISQLVTTVRTPHFGKGLTPGGDGGGGMPMRSVFKYTAYWNAHLETDAAGRAAFSFKVPDNLTGWRILVIALRPGAAMGLGKATVRVDLPIQLNAALPDLVHAGDRFAAGFSVTNRTTVTRRVHVAVSANGAATGHATGALTLRPYAHGLQWLNLRAEHPGVIHLLARAHSSALGDALRKSIPVAASGTAAASAEYGSLTGGTAAVPVQLPSGVLPGSARLVVHLAPSALSSLAAAFRTMRGDSLPTWEVRLSRAVMAADYLRLRTALPATLQWPGARAEIRATLEHAANFQAGDGGMSFLIPRAQFVSPYLSAYTALAFDWLAADGYRAPASVRLALEGYLRTQVLNVAQANGRHGMLDVQVAALQALALAGRAPPGEAASLVPKLPQLNLFGKALLLQLALTEHDRVSTRRILTALLARSEQTSGDTSFQETRADAYSALLASPLRDNCAVLDALVSLVEDKAPGVRTVAPLASRLVRWIDAQRSTAGQWPNPQQNVFCTTAEAHYAGVFEPPLRALGGRVVVAGKPILTAEFSHPRSAPRTGGTAVVGAPTVRITHSGLGRLYYSVRLDYQLPPALASATDAGFSIRRRYRIQQGARWVRIGPQTVLHRGEVVRVDLTVDVPAERHYVVVTDPLPGAFEAVNHQLATADMTAPEHTPGGAILWFDYGAWPNDSITTYGFYHRQIGRGIVRFYADRLPAGHYRLIYAVQVIARGRFLAPPPRVHEIYQPEVYGRGRARTVEVVPAPSHQR
ncbi:MAG: alpha-2-macroglobulin family protein [Steroidobacteraceae bacterium]